jgi:hypothetical protein
MRRRYALQSKVVVYPGMGGWRFLVVPLKQGAEIKKKFGARAKGWGSLPAAITIGKTKWRTSIFPDKKSGTYLLPLKAQVRKAEEIDDEDTVRYTIDILI